MIYILFVILTILLIFGYLINTHVVEIEANVIDYQTPSELNYIHISDLHNKLFYLNGRLSSIINKNKPKFVVATGDYSNNQRSLSKVIFELSKVKCEVYMILGNYEREEEQYLKSKRKISIDLLRQEVGKYKNLHLLINESIEMQYGKSKIYFHGFDNSTYGNEKEIINYKKDENDYTILMAHSPNIINYIKKHNYDYNHLLVGHTHGKQVNISFNKTFYDKYHIGLKRVSEDQFFSISKGLGTVRIPLRVNSRPTINIYNTRCN